MQAHRSVPITPNTPPRRMGGPAPRQRPKEDSERGMVAGGVLFLVAAVLTLARSSMVSLFVAEEAVPLDNTVYASAFVSAILGIALLQKAEAARKFVLWSCALVVVLLIGLGIWVVGMAPDEVRVGAAVGALLVFLFLLLPVAGIVGLLQRGEMAVRRVAICTATVLLSWIAGLAGEVFLLRIPKRDARRAIEEWAVLDREYRNDALGVRIALPNGWVLLKKGSPVAESSAAEATLAHTAAGAFAELTAVEGTTVGNSLNQYLDRVIKVRGESLDEMKELHREDALVGITRARKSRASWAKGREGFRGILLAWQEKGKYLVLSSWFPEARVREGDRQFEALEKSLTLSGADAALLKSLVDGALEECPHLTRLAVETLVAKRKVQTLAPGEAFRMGYLFWSRGMEFLNPLEVQEIGQIMSSVFDSMPPKDRARLGVYIENAKFGRPTTPRDDLEMSRVMRAALQKLPAESQERLRNHIEKAVALAGDTQ